VVGGYMAAVTGARFAAVLRPHNDPHGRIRRGPVLRLLKGWWQQGARRPGQRTYSGASARGEHDVRNAW